jgi:uncharacterized protein (TIGR04255 family)
VTKQIPKELKADAVLEAILELRFESPPIPEIFFGRLLDGPIWREFSQLRLPAYDIPAPMRQADANLRYQPVIELQNQTANCSFRVGPQVASYHQRTPYGGWNSFRPKLEEVIDLLFAKIDRLHVTRLGLRYVNALNAEEQLIGGVHDLDMNLRVSGRTISNNVNMNFTLAINKDTSCTVRVATPDFVQGAVPRNTAVYVDLDIYTPEGFTATEAGLVKSWLTLAHESEKVNFFDLFHQSTIDKIKKV